MNPMMMKKWKCASIDPRDRPTSAAEQYTTPTVVKNEATRRRLITAAAA